MANGYHVTGRNARAPFTLKVHRGEGMALLAMNWRGGPPPRDFVGFGIEYREPGGEVFWPVPNRLAFPWVDLKRTPQAASTLQSPIQKFRWVHFPPQGGPEGSFRYRVTPLFMDAQRTLSQGEPQVVDIVLRSDTFPRALNLAFTRGFVSSQAFVERFATGDSLSDLLPPTAAQGLDFVPTHPKAEEALAWMGFEARRAVLAALDDAVMDAACTVRMIAYDLNLPEVVSRLRALGRRLRIVIDDSDEHGQADSAETAAAAVLAGSAGPAQVRRQHVKQLQHNKFIVISSPTRQVVVCGSTNFSWRGWYVQANHVVVLQGAAAVGAFGAAFEQYWSQPAAAFGSSPSALPAPLQWRGLQGEVSFSPHAPANAQLGAVAADMASGTQSNLLYSLAFLYQTEGPVRRAIETLTAREDRFVLGISDRRVGGLDVQMPGQRPFAVHAAALSKQAPYPFSAEPTGGGGTRMHHKFIVVDFNRPGARVYFGSYNFSAAADTRNGEHLLVVRNRRVATAFMVEAVRIFDHYRFRVAQQQAGGPRKLTLRPAPTTAQQQPWWQASYTDVRKVRDRELFA